jgi:anti-sigma regulatory factor (Ser/Thr protein kinase)
MISVPSIDLPAEPSSPGRARRFVRAELADARLDPDLLADVELLVAELASNAVLHARTGFTVAVDQHGEVVRVQVKDGSNQPPIIRPHQPDAVTGRGLILVDRIATRWGVDPNGRGKIVWVELTGNSR